MFSPARPTICSEDKNLAQSCKCTAAGNPLSGKSPSVMSPPIRARNLARDRQAEAAAAIHSFRFGDHQRRYVVTATNADVVARGMAFALVLGYVSARRADGIQRGRVFLAPR